eukprot:jgi/Chrzof1/875/Cz01g32100.t1
MALILAGWNARCSSAVIRDYAASGGRPLPIFGRTRSTCTTTCRFVHVCANALPEYASSSRNLGVLNSVVQQGSSEEDAYHLQRVSPDSFSNRGLYTDASAIFGSLVLLVVLLGIAFERILGLDRLIANALKAWKERQKYETRNKVINARQQLEQQWSGESDSDDGTNPPGTK